MSASAITFDQLESSADHTLACVLWAKRAQNVLLGATLTAIAELLLARLVSSMTAEKLNSLTPEQAAELRKSLQELHSHLVYILRHRICQRLSDRVLFRRSISGLAEGAEDLGDIIEDLVLASNPQFKTLVSDCVQALSQEQAVGAIGHM